MKIIHIVIYVFILFSQLKRNFVIRSGTLGIFFQLLLVIGILYAYCCGYARNVVTTTGLCLVGPILFVIMMIFMPESPMFYMVKRNEEAAKRSMRFFRGPDYEEIDDELAIFKVSVSILFNPFLSLPKMYVLLPNITKIYFTIDNRIIIRVFNSLSYL